MRFYWATQPEPSRFANGSATCRKTTHSPVTTPANHCCFATAMGNYVAGWVAGLVGHRTYSEVFMIAFVTAAIATMILAVMIPVIKRLMAGVN